MRYKIFCLLILGAQAQFSMAGCTDDSEPGLRILICSVRTAENFTATLSGRNVTLNWNEYALRSNESRRENYSLIRDLGSSEQVLQNNPPLSGSFQYNISQDGSYTLCHKATGPSGTSINNGRLDGRTIKSCQTIAYTSAPSSIVYPSLDTDGNYTVSWSTSVAANRYVLYRQIGNTAGLEIIYNGPATQFNETGIGSGQYRYWVVACTPNMCTPGNQGALMTVNLSPDKPASMTVSPYSAARKSTISWPSAARATRYELEQQKNDGSWSTAIYSGNALSYEISGLEHGSNYRFRVRACHDGGCSEYTTSGVINVDLIAPIIKRLYYDVADAVPATNDDPDNNLYSRELAAFRYLDLSYALDPGTGQVIYRVGNSNDDQDFSVLYGAAERTRALQALDFTKDLLNESLSDALRKEAEYQLLNIYYDRAVAEMIIANQKLDQARKTRLIDGDINAEIAAYKQAIEALENGFNDHWQVMVDHPIILTEVSASRGQISPRYVNQDGDSVDVSDNNDLFTGYKDVRVLYDLMNAWGEATYKSIRLILSSGETDSVVIAQLRSDAEQLRNKLIASDTKLREVFSPIELETLSGFTGVPEAIAQFKGTLSQLANIDTWLTGETNLLGLPDKAVLIMFEQNANANGDSFDSIISNHNPNTGSLALAKQRFNAAKGSYDTFQRTKQNFQTDYSDRMLAVNDSLKGLIGWEYNESCEGTPCVTRSDTAVQGSTIALQTKNIEAAQKRVERDELRLTNLLNDIEIEIDRFGKANGVDNAIQEVIVEYGKQQVNISVQIAKLRAQAERARRKGSILGAAVRVVAAYYSFGLSEAKNAYKYASEASKSAQSIQNHNINIRQIKKEGELQALSQQLAYEERAKIQVLQAEIDEINFRARIRSMWLQANILSLDIALAEANVEVEMDRLVGLMNQTNRLLVRAMDLQSGLIDNYFADPIHLKRVNKDLEISEYAFDRAQEWMFYAAQALEYKWQEPFVSDLGMKRDSVFALRNAGGLEVFYHEMKNFNDLRKLRSFQENTDSLSLKEDILGYYNTIRGEPQSYPHPDPAIGASQMLSAKDAFKAYLRFNLLDFGDEQWISFDFNTLKPVAPINFFKGPRIYERNGEQCIFNGGNYNDKIIDIGVNILSKFGAPKDKTTIELTYGGSSYFRARQVENVPDILNTIDRFNTLASRFWDVSGANTLNYKNNYTVSFSAAITDESAGIVYPTSSFKERSVASSGWKLAIFAADEFGELFDIDGVSDIEIVIKHKYLPRNIQTCNAGFLSGEIPQELMFFEEELERDSHVDEK